MGDVSLCQEILRNFVTPENYVKSEYIRLSNLIILICYLKLKLKHSAVWFRGDFTHILCTCCIRQVMFLLTAAISTTAANTLTNLAATARVTSSHAWWTHLNGRLVLV